MPCSQKSSSPKLDPLSADRLWFRMLQLFKVENVDWLIGNRSERVKGSNNYKRTAESLMTRSERVYHQCWSFDQMYSMYTVCNIFNARKSTIECLFPILATSITNIDLCLSSWIVNLNKAMACTQIDTYKYLLNILVVWFK